MRLHWNPCMSHSDSASRLGVLAAVSDYGRLSVLSVPHISAASPMVYPVDPVILQDRDITCVKWSPVDARRLLAGDADGYVHLWHLDESAPNANAVQQSAHSRFDSAISHRFSSDFETFHHGVRDVCWSIRHCSSESSQVTYKMTVCHTSILLLG